MKSKAEPASVADAQSPSATSTTSAPGPSAALPSASATTSSLGNISRSISACNRCRSRKTKCDQKFPSCTACAKAGVECVGIDAATGREVPRSYVCYLEERVKFLESYLPDGENAGRPFPSSGMAMGMLQQSQSVGRESESQNQWPNRPSESERLGPGMNVWSLNNDSSMTSGDANSSPMDARQSMNGPYLASGEYDRKFSSSSSGTQSDRKSVTLPTIDNLVSNVGMVAVRGTSEPTFLGGSSGISFAKLMFAAVKCKEQQAQQQAPPAPTSASGEDGEEGEPPDPSTQLPFKPKPSPAQLPTRENAEQYIEIYFQQTNPQTPILYRPAFMQRVERVYQRLAGGFKSSKQSGRSSASDTHASRSNLSLMSRDELQHSADLYFLNMVFAIGTGMNQRYGNLPEEFHAAAMMHVDTAFASSNRLDSLSGILLLALYSIMRPAAPGVWYVLGAALRLCVDMGLHQQEPPKQGLVDLLLQDERRRLFWCTYSLDRQVCVYLGRPFGISDDAIKCPYPEDLDDEDFANSSNYDQPPTPTSVGGSRNGRTVARHMFKIRQLQSEIQRILYQTSQIPRQFATLEDWRADMELRLNEWCSTVPKSRDEANCGYNLGFIDLNYQQTRLLLYGLSPAVPSPSPDAFLIIADSGSRVIKTYRQLHRDKSINYTWLACHNLFMAGTSYLYALWHSPDVRRNTSIDEIDFNTLACRDVLDGMIDRCPAAVGCRDTFEVLSSATVQLCSGEYGRDPSQQRSTKRTKMDSGSWRSNSAPRLGSSLPHKVGPGAAAASEGHSPKPTYQHALPASLAHIVHSSPSPLSPAPPQPSPGGSYTAHSPQQPPPPYSYPSTLMPPPNSIISPSPLSPNAFADMGPNLDQVFRLAAELPDDVGGASNADSPYNSINYPSNGFEHQPRHPSSTSLGNINGGNVMMDANKVYELINEVGGGHGWDAMFASGANSVGNAGLVADNGWDGNGGVMWGYGI